MKIEANTLDAYKLFHNGALALARAERQGIRIDIPYCEKMKRRLTRRIKRYRRQLEDTKLYRLWTRVYGTKAKIESNHQLSRLLYQTLKIEPPKSTAGGEGSTDDETLRQLDVPGLSTILTIRKLTKMRDTYLDAFAREQVDGYIHPSFNLNTVRTYRSSSSNPNFQNIPKRDKEAMRICRRALLPRPGHMLMEMDFSALEVNISACHHKDPVMLNYLRDKTTDMHGDMAKQLFILDQFDRKLPAHYTLRQAAKNGFVFPQFYGDYYGNNAMSLCEWVKLPRTEWGPGMGVELPDGSHISDHFRAHKISSFDDLVEHVKQVEDDFWNNRFKVYNAWKAATVAKYRRRGYLRMFTGFVCSGVMRRNEIVNYPIQGSAFHCLLWTFIQLDQAMLRENWDSRLIGQIHDSILVDAHPDEAEHVIETAEKIVASLPKHWPWIITPLEIEVDRFGVDQPWVA